MTGNVFDHNLVVFVKSSTSLQNDDITPAAFWVTNPNNTVTNNVAAGGTHFGFWYRMHSRPDGVSFDPNICPRKVEIGEFRDNIVHSQGWFGIWIFQVWTPMEGSCCNCSNPIAAKLYGLTAWNNEKGAESVGGGAIQFHDFMLVNNDKAGVEMKLILNARPYDEQRGAMFKNLIIAAKPSTTGIMDLHTTQRGAIMPYARGLLSDNVTFINFDETGIAAFGVTSIQGTAGPNNGGFTYFSRNLTFINSPNKVAYRWQSEAVFHDLDGTLTGTTDGKVIPDAGILPPDHCTFSVAEFSVGIPGAKCTESVKFHRWSFNRPVPVSLLFKDTEFRNVHGAVRSKWEKKRITHKKGWMVLLVGAMNHTMSFVGAEQVTNITYTGTYYDFTVSVLHRFAGMNENLKFILV